MQTKKKIGILSGIMAVAALYTASIAPSALAQYQDQIGYGFIYHDAKSGHWGYIWESEMVSCQNTWLGYRGNIQKMWDSKYISPYDIVYECQRGTDIQFQYAVAERNRGGRY